MECTVIIYRIQIEIYLYSSILVFFPLIPTEYELLSPLNIRKMGKGVKKVEIC